MKKYAFLFVLTLAFGILPVVPVEAQELYLPVVLNHYCKSRSLNFLAFGDSITGCYFDSFWEVAFPYCGYEKRVYDRLNRDYGSCLTALSFYNKSEGGETTPDGLARFQTTIATPTLPPVRLYPETATNTVPDLVIIMEGTNDMNVGIPDLLIESNLRQMVDLARGQGKLVILATIPPAFGADEAVRQQRIEHFNPTIFQIGVEKKIPVADVFGRLVGHPEWAAADGLHFNDAGFDQMADVFLQTLVNLLGL